MRHLTVALSLSAPAAHADCLILSDESQAWRLSGPSVARMAEACVAAGPTSRVPLPSGKVPFQEIVVLGNSPEAVAIALEAGADPDITDGRPCGAVDMPRRYTVRHRSQEIHTCSKTR